MTIKGLPIALGVAGGLIMYSGIKGATIAATIRAVLSGDLTLSNTESITQTTQSSSGSSPNYGGGDIPANIPNGSAAKMVAFMMAQRGKPYSEAIPARFGPDVYDCSGLVWAAANAAGVGMPGGPHNDAAAIVDPELQWAGSLAGAKVITNVSQVQAGDIVGFWAPDATTHGSAKMDPDGNTLHIGSVSVKSMGHIGMAINPLQYISAYDTASGILVNPITGDQFVCAVRLP
jgi:cell wall-associated NlpC family hydrolase